ncbi:hypothetical protein ACJX0J_027167 [Zea mays]
MATAVAFAGGGPFVTNFSHVSSLAFPFRAKFIVVDENKYSDEERGGMALVHVSIIMLIDVYLGSFLIRIILAQRQRMIHAIWMNVRYAIHHGIRLGEMTLPLSVMHEDRLG